MKLITCYTVSCKVVAGDGYWTTVHATAN